MSSKSSPSINKYNILLNLSKTKVPSLNSVVSSPSIPSTTLTLEVLILGSSPVKLLITSSKV